jgi:hypothetical protein
VMMTRMVFRKKGGGRKKNHIEGYGRGKDRLRSSMASITFDDYGNALSTHTTYPPLPYKHSVSHTKRQSKKVPSGPVDRSIVYKFFDNSKQILTHSFHQSTIEESHRLCSVGKQTICKYSNIVAELRDYSSD